MKNNQKKGTKRSQKDVFGDEWLLNENMLKQQFQESNLNDDIAGFIMGYSNDSFLVNSENQNTLILAPPDTGKTKTHALTNSIFNSYKNVSQIIMDSKDEIRKKTQAAFEKRGIKTYVLDLRNSLKSMHWNLMDLVNKYIDLYKFYSYDEYLATYYYSRAEEYAIKIATAIINQEDDGNVNSGDNAFFRDAAKGLLVSMILLVSEHSDKQQRHIKSVYKTIQSFSGMEDDESQTNQLMSLFKTLNKNKTNDISKISDFGFASATADIRTFKNIVSSTLVQIQDFLQSDLEQILCHDSDLDINNFVKEKSVIYIIVPDEKKSRHFLGSLFVQNFVTELITIAEQNENGILDRKVICYWDEFGNMPKIPDYATFITAARSRGINIINVLQSLRQWKRTYGEDVYEILKECYQNVLVGCLSPLATDTARVLSEATGEYTLSYKTNSSSTSFFSIIPSNTSKAEQLVKRAVLKPEDFKKLKKGEWVVFSLGNSVYKYDFKMYSDVFDYDFKNHTIKNKPFKKVSVAKDTDILTNVLYQYELKNTNISTEYVNNISLI